MARLSKAAAAAKAAAEAVATEAETLCAECFPGGWSVPGGDGAQYTNATCEHGAYVNDGTPAPVEDNGFTNHALSDHAAVPDVTETAQDGDGEGSDTPEVADPAADATA